ncbi:MAG: TonB-dependent receptor [Calditrichaceae bacterium]|nr:TonB-dependent receptor [Calditrichaceae bacterium]MBN2710280.1 TonB-dependent receptor [Calditrichaceae bacterium]RQV93899.1 MAG: TonB-dependent receptor [Calditrichota bacterium]
MYRIMMMILMTTTLVFASSGPGARDAATISGFVYNKENGEALIGANVYFENLAMGASTNVSGYYVIPSVPIGRYILVCDYLGFETYKKTIEIVNGENVKLNIYMNVSILETEEIVITADSIRTAERLYRKPISTVQLNPKQINQVPQVAEADLLRSLQTLPGIAPISDFSTALYIRGGTPDQNLHLLDGTDVYNPEHMFGLFSTFNADAIKHIELSKGGFGAEYGGRLSSVLDITNLDGNREKFEGRASISVLSAKTTLQMPIGNFGSISGAIRRTYFDKTVAEFIDDIPDYYFYDGSIKAFFELDKNNRLTLSYYGGNDYLDYKFNTEATEKKGFTYDWGNKTASLRWTRVFTPRLFSNFWVTYSIFRSRFKMNIFDMYENNDIDDLTFKGNLEYHYSDKLAVKFGFEQKNLEVSYIEDDPQTAIDIKQDAMQISGYTQLNIRPTQSWLIETGVRYNYFDSDKTFRNWAPRFSTKYKLNETIGLKAAYGRYYQYLNQIDRFMVSDVWSLSGKSEDRAYADHYLVGYQQEIQKDYELEVEAFYKKMNNTYSFNQNIAAEMKIDTYTPDGRPLIENTKYVFKRGDSKSYGFEFLLRKDVGRLNGWIGYTYAHTLTKIDGINLNRWFAPRHDRSSTVNLVTNIDLLKEREKLVLGMNFIYSSGQPITEPGSAYVIASSPFDPYRSASYAPTKINNIRLPFYARMDLSLTYKIQYKNWSMSPYLQIFNIGNRKNVWFIEYDYDEGKPEIEVIQMMPLLPTVGVNFVF